MKRIEANISSVKLDDVKEAVRELGIEGMTVIEAKSDGKQWRRELGVYRGEIVSTDEIPGILVLVVVGDAQADAVVEAIRSAADWKGAAGSMIYVSHLHDSIRIRTEERGERSV